MEALKISMSGMDVEWQRLRVIAENLANMNSTRDALGRTYVPQRLVSGPDASFEAMLAGVLPMLSGGAPMISASLRVERGEGDIAEPLGDLAETHPEVSIGSYPFQRDGLHGSNVVVRAQNGAAVESVMGKLRALFPEAT